MSKYKDVGYAVHSPLGDRYFDDSRDAFVAVGDACVSSGQAVLDVIISSRAGAKAFGGDDAVAQYDEDPEASVFERFEFWCNSVGRVP